MKSLLSRTSMSRSYCCQGHPGHEVTAVKGIQVMKSLLSRTSRSQSYCCQEHRGHEVTECCSVTTGCERNDTKGPNRGRRTEVSSYLVHSPFCDHFLVNTGDLSVQVSEHDDDLSATTCQHSPACNDTPDILST